MDGTPPPAAPATGSPAAPPAPTGAGEPVAEQTPCPQCGMPRTGRFCEQDGYDFVAASLGGAPAAPPAPSTTPTNTGWQIVVGADRAYFDIIRAQGGADAELLAYPRFVPERRFPLSGERVTIGRQSRSRGIYPDIDLVGPPEDPGVSRLHALLLAQPDHSWAVVDLDSANGTYVNDPATEPIESHVPIPVGDGDTIYLGAWTTLTVRAAGPQ
jgi:hypothetical protein